MNFYRITSLIIASFICLETIAVNAQITPENKFDNLRKQLEDYGFTVKIEPPPRRSTYGLLQTTTKTIWINPIVFDLKIALPTLIHEATHAAQVCVGNGEISPLELSLTAPNISRRFFMRYNHGLRRHLEAQAYTIQTHPDGYELVTQLLQQHCTLSVNR